MQLLRRLTYYVRSIPTLLTGIVNWPATTAACLRRSPSHPFEIQLRPTGVRLLVRNRMDVWLAKETCLDRDYERVGVAVRDGWNVIDIGASIGDYAIDVATRNPRATIHAYEPSLDAFRLLEANVSRNDVRNVRLFREAVGGSVPLSRVLARLNAPCDLLKMDCEGAEYPILFTAADETLADIRRVVMEYHDGAGGHRARDLVAFLGRKGFRVRTTTNPAHRHLGFLFATRLREASGLPR